WHDRNVQRPPAAAAIVRAALEILDLAEHRRHVLPAPAPRAHLRPGVVVERLSAHPDKAIDRARSPDHLAARYRNAAIARACLRLGLVKPVRCRIMDQQTEADRQPGI